jgi:hypothetical protein
LEQNDSVIDDHIFAPYNAVGLVKDKLERGLAVIPVTIVAASGLQRLNGSCSRGKSGDTP